MPQERFIDIAIDHGTANSAIAVMTPEGPRILMPSPNDPTMPSAVFLYKTGTIAVGQSAATAIRLQSGIRGDGVRWYKRTIGQGVVYDFPSANKKMTAPEVGGLVVGALLEVFRREFPDREPQACVISIPAEFDQPAIEGTRQAAHLAGLSQVETIQEPVAAGMAFGFDNAGRSGRWLVVDLGAGTLDVTLLYHTRNGLEVPRGAHDGDTNLGGTVFDQILFEHVVKELSGTHKLQKLLGPSKDNIHQRNRNILLPYIEQAKIGLSDRTEVELSSEFPLTDDQGRKVEVSFPIARPTYERLIEPLVGRVVETCRRLLDRHRIARGDLDGILLIGGPTKTPYVRQRLVQDLGIPIVEGVDPMTAVARGAAIYAATRPLDQVPPGVDRRGRIDPSDDAPVGRFELHPEPSSETASYLLTGQLQSLSEVLAAGVYVSAVRTDGLWQSDRSNVHEDGFFELDLLLISDRPRVQSTFEIQAKDAQGRSIAEPEEVSIWYALPVANNQLANSIRVGLIGNRTMVMVPTGQGLPARSRSEVFTTTKALKRGQGGDALDIPVLESVKTMLGTEDDHLYSSKHIGSLSIRASDQAVTQDLPIGTEINVMIEMDASRQITIVAEVPVLGQEFAATFNVATYEVSGQQLRERLLNAEPRIGIARKVLAFERNDRVEALLGQTERQRMLDSIRQELEMADGTGPESASAISRAYARLVELHGTLEQIEAMQQKAHLAWMIEDIYAVAEALERKILDDTRDEFRSADPTLYPSLKERLESLNQEVRRSDLQKLAYAEVGIAAMMEFDDNGLTAPQREVGRQAKQLSDSLFDQGAWRTMGKQKIEEVREMNRRLEATFPANMLADLRQMVRDHWRDNPRGPIGPRTGIDKW